MNHSLASNARWSTTSYGNSAVTSPMDLQSLQAHVVLCKEPQRFTFVLQQSGKVLGSFLTARVITTLVTVVLTAVLIRAW
jgi:hypothetical protein